MSARLSQVLSDAFQDPASRESFFSVQEKSAIRDQYEIRENVESPISPCDTNLFIGVFFDGTGNNYADSLDREDHSQSNVARLYSAFRGQSVPGVLPPQTDWQTSLSDYDNFFRVYATGVGAQFEAVGDSGERLLDKTLGCRYGATRTGSNPLGPCPGSEFHKPLFSQTIFN
ncbi:DUF2235 domain-containing protein [Salinicola aestuarinus]|uniref:DUF2235 domain-containing protein n=1 Tax=Salinicola aestuarinus TaxID=1949082 RepID=UPI000DA26816|nr:DUF2235 domain-containing protein [Salinicola aestuarinus]